MHRDTGQELYRLRLALDLSQSQIARLIGRHPQTISDWERGNRQGAGYDSALRFLRYLAHEAGGRSSWDTIGRIVSTPFYP